MSTTVRAVFRPTETPRGYDVRELYKRGKNWYVKKFIDIDLYYNPSLPVFKPKTKCNGKKEFRDQFRILDLGEADNQENNLEYCRKEGNQTSLFDFLG